MALTKQSGTSMLAGGSYSFFLEEEEEALIIQSAVRDVDIFFAQSIQLTN